MMRNSILTAMAALLLSGCLISVDSDSRPLRTGWSESDVSRLALGESDTQFVRDVFGEPISKQSRADGGEVWQYRNRSERDTEVGVFLIFSVDVEEERTEPFP